MLHRAQIIAKRDKVESNRIAREFDRYDDMINELTTLQLKHTPTVVILATRCDSIEECWNGDDEKFCGIPFTTSLILGWSNENLDSIVMNRIYIIV